MHMHPPTLSTSQPREASDLPPAPKQWRFSVIVGGSSSQEFLRDNELVGYGLSPFQCSTDVGRGDVQRLNGFYGAVVGCCDAASLCRPGDIGGPRCIIGLIAENGGALCSRADAECDFEAAVVSNDSGNALSVWLLRSQDH